eukprot:691236-Pelagomonas_calceolata.AAC.2
MPVAEPDLHDYAEGMKFHNRRMPAFYFLVFRTPSLSCSAPYTQPAGQQADTYIVINATSVELTNVREYVNRMAPPGILNAWSDLLWWQPCLPQPHPALQFQKYRQFLCQFRPVFFLRLRDYSKSVNVAPFLVNYSGALFREFPGPWQKGTSKIEFNCIIGSKHDLIRLLQSLHSSMHPSLFPLCCGVGATVYILLPCFRQAPVQAFQNTD